MDIALGVSMAPTAIRMVLVEGENADGVTVDEDSFGIAAPSAGVSAADQVISAILGTREGAAEGGHQLASTGVTWTNPADGNALRDALAAHKVSNVMLVSAFLAAAALAQTVGNAIHYEHIALLYVEPETATLAVVNSDDGSVTDVYRRPLRSDNVTAELATMIAGLDGLERRPGGLFVVGSGVDVAPIKPVLERATWLPVCVPEEPDTALARGAALASASAPLFASSTAAVAYAQDPGTGEVNPFALAPGYFEVTADRTGAQRMAYSAVADEDTDAEDTAATPVAGGGGDVRKERGPLMLVGSALAAIAAAGAVATVITLAVNIRQTVAFLPTPVQHLIIPTEQAPAPPPAVVAPVSPPAVHLAAPAAPAPAAVPPAPAPPVALPAPAVPAPVPVPAAPAPVPVPVPIPAAPAPVPIPVPVPIRVPVPVQAPQPPVNLIPTPPAKTPTPPVHQPTPPVHVPTPPVQTPTPPVQWPRPPVQTPTPPAHVPTPPAHVPTPPAHAPSPPVQVFAPQPPAQVFAPQPPVSMPAPEPPLRLPAPVAPQVPSMPAPLMPRMPAPAAPAMPAPVMPRMPAPVMPRMPAPVMPRFNFPGLRF